MPHKEEIRDSIESVSNYSWRIDYKGATCKFESSSPEDAVIHHLEVPDEVENQGIGTAMIEVVESFVKTRTEASVLYAQIGADSGAVRHILRDKLGFEVLGLDEREQLGTVVDAQKNLTQN